MLPKANPYELFQSLNARAEPLKPADLLQYKEKLKPNFEEENLLDVRDVLKKQLNNNVSALQELK